MNRACWRRNAYRQEYRHELVITTAGVIAGCIRDVRPHPNADRLALAVVDLGPDYSCAQIVFGGRLMLSQGDLVAVAVPGSRLRPGGKKMRRRNYRGQSSWGMLCSLVELGWDHRAWNEVALLRNVKPGDNLDGYAWDWWTIVRETEPVGRVVIPALRTRRSVAQVAT